MIENPKVGQRVWWLDLEDGNSTVEFGCITDIPGPRELVWVRDKYGDKYGKLTSQLYDSHQSAAAALSAEAQRLSALAEKLESEASDGT